MKKSFKKYLAAMLSVALLATMVSFSAFASVDTTQTTVTELTIGTGGTFNGSGVAPSVLTDVGGAEGYVMGWDFTSYTEPTNGKRYDFPVHDATTMKQHTYEFNMYADGNAVAHLYYTGGNKILRWDPDGSLWFLVDKTMTNMGTYERGKWLHVALSYRSGDRYILYVNDEQLSDFSGWGIGNGKMFGFGVGDGSYGGIVAYDDIIKYDGLFAKYGSEPVYHDASDHAITTDGTETIQFVADSEKIIFKNCADVAALTSEIQLASGAQYVKVFNADMTAAAAELSEAKLAVIKSVGDVYYYYDLEEDVISKIGLSVIPAENTSNIITRRMKVLDDSLAVFSSPDISGYWISSKDMLENLTSSKGYTLSYVLEKDGEDASVDSVVSGYLKAVKDDEVFYLPIVKQVGKTNVSLSDVKNDGYGANKVTKTGVAGNPSTAVGFTPNTATTNPGNGYRIGLKANADANGNKGYSSAIGNTFTYVFNIYADGNSDATIHLDGYSLLKWTQNGEIYMRNDSFTEPWPETPAMTNIKRGQWHQIAITFNSGSCRPIFYVDGVSLTTSKAQPPYVDYNTKSTLVALGIDSINNGSTTGQVLYSDVVYYEGYFYNEGDLIVPNKSDDTIKIDAVGGVIYHNGIDSIDALKAAVLANTDASVVTVYTNDTDYVEATEITSEVMVMAKSANGMRYKCFNPEEITLSDITTTVSDGNISASVKAFDETYEGYSLIIASYDGGFLKAVDVAKVTAVDGSAATVATITYDETLKVKTFFWNGVAPIVPDMVYSK